MMLRISCSTLTLILRPIWIYVTFAVSLMLHKTYNRHIHALQYGFRNFATATTNTKIYAKLPSLYLFSPQKYCVNCCTKHNKQCWTAKKICTDYHILPQHLRLSKLYSVAISPKTGLPVFEDDNFADSDESDEYHHHQEQQQRAMSPKKPELLTSKPFATSSCLAAVAPEAHNAWKKRRVNNEAFRDVNFLRKRTAGLLKATSLDVFSPTDYSSPACNNPMIGRKMKINLNTFNFLIDGWAFSGARDAVDKAIALLKRMEELYFNYGSDSPVCPDVRSYTKVINALSRSKQRGDGEIVEQILSKMEHVSTNGENPSAKPNTYTYTAAIEAFANSRNDDSPQRAEQMLERMINAYYSGGNHPEVIPNARCFNAVISSYAKSDLPGAALRAQNLFDKLNGLYMSGVEDAKPNRFNYNSLITAWANYRATDATYTGVATRIDERDNCNKRNYNDADHYHQQTHEIVEDPNFCSAKRAHEILERMEQCYMSGDESSKPDIVSFNAVIDAYAKSSRDDAAENAEQILRWMGRLNKEGRTELRPNTRSFNTVINAWAKSGRGDLAAERAESLLNMMTRLYEDGNNNSVRPDVHTYCTVINAYARSQIKYKAERANNLFRNMKEMYDRDSKSSSSGGDAGISNGNKKHQPSMKPNVVAVNAVINACAFTSAGDIQEQNRAMEIAHTRLKDLEKSNYGSPDHITYGTFLRVCSNQMPDCHTRQQIIKVIFQRSARDGQVGNLVLQQLTAMGPPELFLYLTGRTIEENVKMEDLPVEWWSNVVEGRWRRQKKQ